MTEIQPQDIKAFGEHGFIKLAQLFSAPELDEVRRVWQRFSFDDKANDYTSLLGEYDSGLLSILRAAKCRRALRTLTNRQLLLVATQGFNTSPSVQGLKWHCDRNSFRFLLSDWSGYTLWIPLIDIDPNGQRGGIAFISKQMVSGEKLMRLGERVADLGKEVQDDYDRLAEANNFVDNAAFDALAQEPALRVGDAILFDRFTFHRSVPLLPGRHRHRPALVLRFIDREGCFNKAGISRFSDAAKGPGKLAFPLMRHGDAFAGTGIFAELDEEQGRAGSVLQPRIETSPRSPSAPIANEPHRRRAPGSPAA